MRGDQKIARGSDTEVARVLSLRRCVRYSLQFARPAIDLEDSDTVMTSV
jgi:uncharacterized ferredoxin-like protein